MLFRSVETAAIPPATTATTTAATQQAPTTGPATAVTGQTPVSQPAHRAAEPVARPQTVQTPPPAAEAPTSRRRRPPVAPVPTAHSAFAPPAHASDFSADTGMPVIPSPEEARVDEPNSDTQPPTDAVRTMTRPVLPVAQHDVPEQLTLAEKLGLRAPGEKPDHTGEQNVGPTR